MQALYFKNTSDEDFTWAWNSVEETVKAGEEVLMEDWKARHFAKHFIDRELNRRGVRLDLRFERDKVEKDVLRTPDTVISNSDILEAKFRAEFEANNKRREEATKEFEDLEPGTVSEPGTTTTTTSEEDVQAAINSSRLSGDAARVVKRK